MEYYKDNYNSLMHGIGFSISKLESILKNGILSQNEAFKRGIFFSRMHSGYNLEDTISLVSTMYTYSNDFNSAYYNYIEKGVSFVINPNISYISNKNECFIYRPDEVLVEGKIDVKDIEAIVIPEQYASKKIEELPILPSNSYNYQNIKNMTFQLLSYIENKISYDKEYVKELLEELKITLQAIRAELKNTLFPNEKDEERISTKINETMFYDENFEKLKKENPEFAELISDFEEVKEELEFYLRKASQQYANKCLNKEDATLLEYTSYINEKTAQKKIYLLEDKRSRKRK